MKEWGTQDLTNAGSRDIKRNKKMHVILGLLNKVKQLWQQWYEKIGKCLLELASEGMGKARLNEHCPWMQCLHKQLFNRKAGKNGL
jgi:hypothetical protein